MKKLPIHSEMEELLCSLGFVNHKEDDDTLMLEYKNDLKPESSIIAVFGSYFYITFREEKWKGAEVVGQTIIIDGIRIKKIEELKFLLSRMIVFEKWGITNYVP